MTKFQHQQLQPMCTNSNQRQGYGPIGAKRPICKTPAHHSHINESVHPGASNIYYNNLQQYRLFNNTQQQSAGVMPFTHYQRGQYDSYLSAPTFSDHRIQPTSMETQATPIPRKQIEPFQSNHNIWGPVSPLQEQQSSPSTSISPLGDAPSPSGNAESLLTLATALSTLQVSPAQTQPFSSQTSPPQISAPTAWPSVENNGRDGEISDSEDDDSDEKTAMTHPNKFPVEIECHDIQHCGYRRQSTRSGPKLKQQSTSVYDPLTAQHKPQVHRIKYYQKHLVRICRCGKYSQMDGTLVHGRANDCDGYEIHYSQKCKWKAYDDFKTGKRVLIRLCKCYKPF